MPNGHYTEDMQSDAEEIARLRKRLRAVIFLCDGADEMGQHLLSADVRAAAEEPK
jgi:hypothetical protein